VLNDPANLPDHPHNAGTPEPVVSRVGPEGGRPAHPAEAGAASPPRPEVVQLRRRVMRSANVAVDMLEASLHALWQVDHAVARSVRGRDDVIDAEEVGIERECLRLLSERELDTQEFRLVTFCLRINTDIERVADHATSIAKVSLSLDTAEPPLWPTALVELGDRVPLLCHHLLRAVLDEDTDAARKLVEGDRIIDEMDRCLFDELTLKVKGNAEHAADALLLFRVGRELERVGDLLASMAEDVVYLVSGEIIRHQGRAADRPPYGHPPSSEPRSGESAAG